MLDVVRNEDWFSQRWGRRFIFDVNAERFLGTCLWALTLAQLKKRRKHAALGIGQEASCDIGGEQTTGYITSGRCPIHRPPEGIQGLIDLDFNTRSWLLGDTDLDIWVVFSVTHEKKKLSDGSTATAQVTLSLRIATTWNTETDGWVDSGWQVPQRRQARGTKTLRKLLPRTMVTSWFLRN